MLVLCLVYLILFYFVYCYCYPLPLLGNFYFINTFLLLCKIDPWWKSFMVQKRPIVKMCLCAKIYLGVYLILVLKCHCAYFTFLYTLYIISPHVNILRLFFIVIFLEIYNSSNMSSPWFCCADKLNFQQIKCYGWKVSYCCFKKI